MADREILTVYAAQIAVGQKNGSGTVIADEGFFFSEVGGKGCNFGKIPRSAKTGLSFQPIHPALSGNYITTAELSLFSQAAKSLELPNRFDYIEGKCLLPTKII
jgi:hypothetical protein